MVLNKIMYRYTYILDKLTIQLYSMYRLSQPLYAVYYLIKKCKYIDQNLIGLSKRFELIEIAKISEPKYYPIPHFSIFEPYSISYSSYSYGSTKDRFKFILTVSNGVIAYFKNERQKPLEFNSNNLNLNVVS